MTEDEVTTQTEIACVMWLLGRMYGNGTLRTHEQMFEAAEREMEKIISRRDKRDAKVA